MTNKSDLRNVKLRFPRKTKATSTKLDVETWIVMLEQMLSCNYDNYTITITTDHYYQYTDVEIRFATVSDAVLFRLQQN
jgi:hypothetical protein